MILTAMKRAFGIALGVLLAGATASAGPVTTLDMTTPAVSRTGTADIGGSFRVDQINADPTGTGVIKSFVRIQKKGNEGGYNTSLYGMGVQPPLDDKGGAWTHALLLSNVPVVNLGGTNYRQFLLDLNENIGSLTNLSTKRFLSLNQIQIFQANADMLHTSLQAATMTAPPLIGFAGATEIFRLNDASMANPFDTSILLDASIGAGSGKGDMFLYVPNSLFNQGMSNVIFYSQFGSPPGANSSEATFEEWAVLGAQSAPEPAELLLLACGIALVGAIRRRRRTR